MRARLPGGLQHTAGVKGAQVEEEHIERRGVAETLRHAQEGSPRKLDPLFSSTTAEN